MSFSHSHFYLYDIGINANIKMYIVKATVPCNLKGKKGVNYKVGILATDIIYSVILWNTITYLVKIYQWFQYVVKKIFQNNRNCCILSFNYHITSSAAVIFWWFHLFSYLVFFSCSKCLYWAFNSSVLCKLNFIYETFIYLQLLALWWLTTCFGSCCKSPIS